MSSSGWRAGGLADEEGAGVIEGDEDIFPHFSFRPELAACLPEAKIVGRLLDPPQHQTAHSQRRACQSASSTEARSCEWDIRRMSSGA